MIRQSISMRCGGKLAGLLAAVVCAVPALGIALPGPGAQGEPKPVRREVIIERAIGSGGSRSFLGVNVREIDAERAKEKRLPEERGVEITSVVPGSAAEKAGLKKGDVVLDYQGQRVEGVEQFVRLVRETPVGRHVTLKIIRDGAEQTLTVTMGTRRQMAIHGKGKDGYIRIPDIRIPEIRIPDMPHIATTWRNTRLGVVAESLQGQLADYFGVKEGVLVRSVLDDSPAAKAGLRAGDVIVRVGDADVASPREITSAIRESKSDTLPVTVMRDKRRLTLQVTLGGGAGNERRLERRVRYTPGARL